MHHPVQAMIALQSPSGLIFGTALALDQDVFTVVVAGGMDPGSAVEFRLELPGLEDTALGMMRVLEVRGERGAASTYLLRVMSVSADDQEAFEGWKSAVNSGVIACSRSRHSSAAGWAEAALAGGTTPEERARAVAIQEERRIRLQASVRQLIHAHKKGWPDPGDVGAGDSSLMDVVRARSSLTPGSPRSSGGRSPQAPVPPPVRVGLTPTPLAVRAGTASGPPQPRPPPVAPVVASPVVAAPVVAAPVVASPAVPAPVVPAPVVVPARPADPVITFREGEVELVWRSLERYRADYKESLRFFGYFAADAPVLEPMSTIRVILVLPAGHRLCLAGQVVAVTPAGTAIQFSGGADLSKKLVPL